MARVKEIQVESDSKTMTLSTSWAERDGKEVILLIRAGHSIASIEEIRGLAKDITEVCDKYEQIAKGILNQ